VYSLLFTSIFSDFIITYLTSKARSQLEYATSVYSLVVYFFPAVCDVLFMVKTVSGRDYHPVLNMPSWILLNRLRQDDSDPRRYKRIVKGPSY
jgi:hypothetical protein